MHNTHNIHVHMVRMAVQMVHRHSARAVHNQMAGNNINEMCYMRRCGQIGTATHIYIYLLYHYRELEKQLNISQFDRWKKIGSVVRVPVHVICTYVSAAVALMTAIKRTSVAGNACCRGFLTRVNLVDLSLECNGNDTKNKLDCCVQNQNPKINFQDSLLV